jgi:hypothetical protein
MLPWCNNDVIVVLQWCYDGVIMVWQWCHNGVTVLLHWCCNADVFAAMDRVKDMKVCNNNNGVTMVS